MRKVQKGIQKYVVVRGIDAHEWDSSTGEEKPEFRTYTAVLKCKDSDKKIGTTSDDSSWKKLECSKHTYYCRFIFNNTGSNGTDKLDVGVVNLFVYDSNKELVYSKMNYARVFETPIM